MAELTGYIYSITNELNGKTYIGKTNNLVRRWKEHCYGHGNTAILNKAFKKYGLEHFIFDIVAQIPFDSINELNGVLAQLEVYYIELYNTFHHGYNATAGGEGISSYRHSEETRRKISQSQIGKILTEEHKAKCRIANLGNHHTEKAKEAIRQALLHRDHSIYDNVASKLKGRVRDHEMVMKAAKKRRKPILQYDLEGNFIKEWEGASCIDGFERVSIGACCKGKLVSTQGYIWRFKESENFSQKIEVPIRWKAFKKPIVQYDLNGNFIAEYESVNSAARSLGIRAANICQCLKGRHLTCGKYIWKYKDEGLVCVEACHTTYTWEKEVLQYDKQGTYIGHYNSITNAVIATGVGRTSISNCLHGRSKTAGGYVWKYKEEGEI